MSEYREVCEQAARHGGSVLLNWWGRIKVRNKGPRDLVTEADLAAQKAIRERLLGRFPSHAFLGEEEEQLPTRTAEYRWIVDPLDGTTNYVHQLPHFAVSVALERNGVLQAGTIFNPVTSDCFTAAKGEGAWHNGQRLHVSDTQALSQALVAASFGSGVRRSDPELMQFEEVLLASRGVQRTGSAALNLAFLAAGRYDAYWSTSTKIWDIAAGVLLVQEAGGIVTGIDGQPFGTDDSRFIAAATPALHGELHQIVARCRAGQ